MKCSRSSQTTLTCILITICFLVADSRAQVTVYSSLNPVTSTSLDTITGNGSNGQSGTGDDYNTGLGSGSFLLTGLSFYGGLGTAPAGDAQDQVNINFYNSSGTETYTLRPTATNLVGVGYHSLLPSDFIQSPPPYVPDQGYIIFAPVSYQTGSVDSDGNFTNTPADPTPTIQLGFGGQVALGTNNTTFAGLADGNGNLTTGLYAPGTSSVPQVAEFSFSTTPEPSSLTLLLLLFPLSYRHRGRRTV